MGWVQCDVPVSEDGGTVFKFEKEKPEEVSAFKSVALRPNRVGVSVSVAFKSELAYYNLLPNVMSIFGERCQVSRNPHVYDAHLDLRNFGAARDDGKNLAVLLSKLREADPSLPVDLISNEALSRVNQVIKNSALMKLNMFVMPERVVRETSSANQLGCKGSFS